MSVQHSSLNVYLLRLKKSVWACSSFGLFIFLLLLLKMYFYLSFFFYPEYLILKDPTAHSGYSLLNM